MDLDDSFTTKLLEKHERRKKYLEQLKSEFISVGTKRLSDEQTSSSDVSERISEESPKRQCLQDNESENINLKSQIMDLDDSFTRKLSEKQQRKKYPNELNSKFLSFGMKRSELSDKQTSKSGISETLLEVSPKRQCLQDNGSENKENMNDEESNLPFVPFQSSSKRGLNALKKKTSDDEEFSSRRAADFSPNKGSSYLFSTNSKDLCTRQKTRLADLAAHINQWEDEVYYTNKSDSAGSESSETCGNAVTSVSISKHADKLETTAIKSNIENDSGAQNIGARIQIWNKAVTATLETPVLKSPVKSSQIAFKRESNNLLLNRKSSTSEDSLNENAFDENYEELNSACANEMDMHCSNRPKKSITFDIKSNADKNAPSKECKDSVDPAELPLSARKALFEKALLNGSPKLNDSVFDFTLSVAQRAAMFENPSKYSTVPRQRNKQKEHFIPPNVDTVSKSPLKTSLSLTSDVDIQKPKDSPVKRTILETVVSPSKNVGSHTRLMQQKLMGNAAANWQQKEIVAKSVEERKKEISSLVNQWEKISSSSSVENNSEVERIIDSEDQVTYDSDSEEIFENENEVSQLSSNEHETSLENEKRIDLCNFEASGDDEEYGDEENDFNLPDGNKDKNYIAEDFSDDVSSKSAPLSSYQITSSIGSSVSLSGVSSYSNGSHYSASQSQSSSSDFSATSNIATPPKSDVVFSDQPSEKEKNAEVPLLYTVSFYRKQKQETRLTPVRTAIHKEDPPSPESPHEADYTQIIQEHIKELQEEILRQQTVIRQTSQALNLCNATAEFSESTEQVEGERLLLIATQKRQAYLNEIQRLKTCGAQGESIEGGVGTLTISDIQLPLKRQFLAAQLEGKGNGDVHYFLCLIRHGAQVIVTQMMSTDDKLSDGALFFTNHIKLQNLAADFSVVFEIYTLQTKKENVPHEKKYRIKREHSKIRLTPKGKKCDGKILAVSSPGGPTAVRSPSFGVIGYTRFNLANCSKTGFTLDKVPFSSPLEGVLKVKLHLHAEHKIKERGFLNMFEEISGFGAWQRRWCVLDGHIISYWKYPENENQKEPIGSIDLKTCVTGTVKLVSRDICARSHTFQLVTIRPQMAGDKNTLISKSFNTITTTKYLLSADSKEERIQWCNRLNEALTTVRKWDPQALRPVESMQDYV